MNVKTPSFDDVDELKRHWTEKYVEVDESRPELKRFAGRTGRVITVNMSGRALVQFDDPDGWGWGRFDIALPFLKQVAAPAPVAKEKAEKHAPAEKPVAAAAATGEAKPAVKKSPLEIMKEKAAAKAAGAGTAPAPAAGTKPAGKMSPLEMIRAKAAANSAESSPAPATESAAPAAEQKPAGKMSPLEMIRAKAAAMKAAESGASGGDAPADTEAKPAESTPDAAKKSGGLSPIELIRQKAAQKKAEQQ